MTQETMAAALSTLLQNMPSPSTGALAGTLGWWLSSRLRRVERRVTVVLRLLVAQTQATGLTPEQKGLVEELLADPTA